jgi:hypothetical protein
MPHKIRLPALGSGKGTLRNVALPFTVFIAPPGYCRGDAMSRSNPAGAK